MAKGKSKTESGKDGTKSQAEKVAEQTTALSKIEGGAITKYGDMFEGYTEEEIRELMDATGTEEIPPEERRPPLIAWNLDMIDDQGVNVSPDKFYNCQTGEMTDDMLIALLGIKRSREYSYHDEAQARKVLVCRSFDMSTGQRVDDYKGEDGEEWRQGDLFNCETCRFKMGKQGQRKDCTIVMRFIAYDLVKNEVFVFNALRSSFIPMSRYLERNFFGQLKIGNQRKDIPMYMLSTKLKLKIEQGHGKKYYVLSPECEGPIEAKETVMALKAMAEQIKKMKAQSFAEEPPKDASYINQPVDDPDDPGISDDDVPF